MAVPERDSVAATVFGNGTIYTGAEAATAVETLAVLEGKVLAAGSRESVDGSSP